MTIEDDLSKVSEIIKQSGIELRSVEVNKPIPIEIDLGNLLAVDSNELDSFKFNNSKKQEQYLKELARDGVQSIINNIWDLPSETIDNLLYVKLPKSSTSLPREKPAPKVRPPTKWEQYAKAKGIHKKKKESKVWDEELKEWVPRYGYKKADAERRKNWVREVPEGSDPFEDQFDKASKAKKERVAKNEYLRLRNIAKNRNIKIPKVGITTESLKGTSELKSALTQTRISTASLGKFQETLKDEKPLPETQRGKKRKLPANQTTFEGLLKEKQRSLDILKKLKTPDMDYESAVNKQVKIDNIIEAHPGKKESNSKRRSKQGGRQRGKSDRKALAKGMKPTTFSLKKGNKGRKPVGKKGQKVKVPGGARKGGKRGRKSNK